jgi:hypothetical protein
MTLPSGSQSERLATNHLHIVSTAFETGFLIGTGRKKDHHQIEGEKYAASRALGTPRQVLEEVLLAQATKLRFHL